MKRSSVLFIAAGILVTIGISIYEHSAQTTYIPLMLDDAFGLFPQPGESISRGFNTADKTDLLFFVDYVPLGNQIDFQIKNEEGVVVFENSINGQFFTTSIILEPDSYYVTEITNKGNEELNIFDMGFLYAADFETGDPLIVPYETTAGTASTLVWFGGIICGIVGIVFYVKDRKKTKS